MSTTSLSTSTNFSTAPELEINGYDEAISGDISNNPLDPLALPLTEETTTLSATTEDGDQEYVTVTVAEGFQLDSLVLESYSNDNAAFIGVQEGDIFTEPLDESADAANLLGYALFGGRARTGEDILDDISNGRDTQGFRGALPSGVYTFALQQLNVDSSYTLAFNVSEVATEPERKANYEWNFGDRIDDFSDEFTGQNTAVTEEIESFGIEDSNNISEAGEEFLSFGEDNYSITKVDSDFVTAIFEGERAVTSDLGIEQFWNTDADLSTLVEDSVSEITG